MVQLSLDLYYTEDEIYELSYTKEPKNPKIQVSRAACFEVQLDVTASQLYLLEPLLSLWGTFICAPCGCNI